MRNAGDVGAILSLLLDRHVSVDLGMLLGNQVANQVLDEEEGDRKECELEVVHLVVIGCLEGRIVPPPVTIMVLIWLVDRFCGGRVNLGACHCLKNSSKILF